MARKTAFVNEMILQTLKQNQQTVSPVVKTLTTLDEKIKNILENNDVDQNKKFQLYTNALQQYTNTRQNLQTTTPQTSVSRPSMVNTDLSTASKAPLTVTPYAEESIIDTIPTTYQRKARNLLRFIKNNDQINWNDRGIVTYNGNTLNGSNIVDLINDVIRPRKHSQPNNWQQFASALHQINVPTDLIGNPKRLNPVKSPIQSRENKSVQWEEM